MKKNLMLCALLLAVLLSGCAAEPLQGQTAGNTPKAPTPQEGTPYSVYKKGILLGKNILMPIVVCIAMLLVTSLIVRLKKKEFINSR